MSKRKGKQQTASGLSERAKKLLNLEEGYDVDFKERLSGLDVEDLVAFANSPTGGAILIGVRETTDDTGRQVGQVVGCDIGDQQKQSILNKAEECMPPIDIEVCVEETTEGSFYRIEIPSGPNKPYCTRKGIYKTRKDGRNAVLHPAQLLSIFLEQEGGRFIERFSQATSAFENQLNLMMADLEDMGAHLSQQLEYTEAQMEQVHDSLSSIFQTAEDASSFADQAMCFSDEALGSINMLEKRVSGIEDDVFLSNSKLDAILKHFGIEDQRITRLRETARLLIKVGHDYPQIDLDAELLVSMVLKSCAFGMGDKSIVERVILEEWEKHEGKESL